VIGGKRPDWFPDWSGECVAIVGGGPSVNQAEVDKLKDRIHVIAVNSSYRLCKWADMLYACDNEWWKHAKGAKDFPGLRVTQDDVALKFFPDLKKVKIRRKNEICHDLLMDNYGEIGGGGNSGFQSMNLALQFGATAIALLGFDFCDFNGKIHWHGRHPYPMNNPTGTAYTGWRKHMGRAAVLLKLRNIDVVNCSPISVLDCFPKMTTEEALRRWTL